jgi:hypothetical protein
MTIAVVKLRDMSPAVRDWVQKLVRKPLGEEDEVSVIVQSASMSAEEREAAKLGLAGRLAKFRVGADSVADEEIDAAVDEAQTSVRPSYTPKR